MQSLWKQTGTLHPAFEKFHRCLGDDWFLLHYELELQRAHARVLAEAGVLTEAELASLLDALAELATEHAGTAEAPDSDAEDLHTWVENELTRRAGQPGRKIHTARSRNDQVATLLQLYLIDRGSQLGERLKRLVSTAAERALDWRDLELPLQTHAQFAAPGSAGSWVLRHAFAFDRDRRLLEHLLGEWRRECALGTGAVAGSSIPIDRRRQAALLGFDGPAPNALDATSRRDEMLQFLGWATQCALHLQAFAADVIGFMQTPFSWLRPLDGLMTGSSMMPNKSNPDALELLRGEANALYGDYVQALTLLKGLPSGYNRDLQCLKPVLHGAMERMHGLTELTAAVIGELQFDGDRLRESMEQGNIAATLRMEARVLEGMPLRDAHHAEAAEAGGRGAVERMGAERYVTLGSASPIEVQRTAEALLATVSEGSSVT